MKKINLLIVLLTSFMLSLQAENHLKPIDLSQAHGTIGTQALFYYEDTSADMNLSDILTLHPNAFIPLSRLAHRHTFSDSVFWYRLQVDNTTQKNVNKLIIFEPAWLDSVTMSTISSTGQIKHYQDATLYPYDIRAIDHFLINYKHIFEPGISTIYVRVKTRDPFIVSLTLMEESAYLREQSSRSLFISFIYGGIIAMLFYNLFLFFTIKKRDYAFYALLLSAFVMMNLSYNGYTFNYLFADHHRVENWSHSISTYLFLILFILFASEFLNLKKHQPKLARLSLYLIFVIVLFFLITLMIKECYYHILCSILFIIVVTSFIVITALYSWFKGNISARFFFFGALITLTSSIITLLTVMSLIPYSYFGYRANDIGIYLNVLFLSFALADRMRLITEEGSIAQKEAKTDSLTGLFNLRSYYDVSASEYQRLVRNIHPFSVIMIDIDDFKTVNDSYGHNVGDNVLKAIANILQTSIREYDYAFRRGGDEFLIFLPDTTQNMAYSLTERIRRQILNTNIKMENYDINITCSFGISEFQEKDNSLEDVVIRADKALYKVKNTKKNSIRIWNN